MLFHMHPMSTPAWANIVTHFTRQLFVSIRHVFCLNMSLDICTISAGISTEAARKYSAIIVEVGIDDFIQLGISISITCRMNRLDISPVCPFLVAKSRISQITVQLMFLHAHRRVAHTTLY